MMTEIDLQISDDHDMSDEDRWQEVVTKIKGGEYDIIIMSPPCSTWSRASVGKPPRAQASQI